MRRQAKALVAVFIATLCLGAAPAAFAASAPEVPVVQASEVNATSARLRTVVVPNEAETTYRFEFGTTESYGQNVPSPDGNLGLGTEDQNTHVVYSVASRLISGLQPDTTYHYRVRAENSEGPVLSDDHTFHTYPSNIPAGLPENRAYELVSPPDKGGADIQGNPWVTVSSVDGNAVTYASTGIFAGAEGNTIIANYLSRRGPDGWSTQGLSPEQEPPQIVSGLGTQSQYVGAFTPDLSKGIYYARVALFGEPSLGKANALYLRDDLLSGNPPNPKGSASYHLLSASVSPLTSNEEFADYFYSRLALTGNSKDLNHITFESKNNLTQDAIDQNLDEGVGKVYAWDEGVERLASIEPDGTPTTGVSGRGHQCGAFSYTLNTTSETGDKRFFTATPNCGTVGESVVRGAVFARINNSVTVKLNESERTDCAGDPTCGGDNEPDPAPDPEGPNTGTMWTATPDGSKAFFLSNEALTDDAKHVDPVYSWEGSNLYRYDFTRPAGERLTYISPSVTKVIGVSDDGNYVYVVSSIKKDLDPSRPFLTTGGNTQFLYAWHDGDIRAVGAGVNSASTQRYYWMDMQTSTRVPPSGRQILFETTSGESAKISGIDSTTSTASSECGINDVGDPCAHETYLYDYDTDTVTCVPCPSTGAAQSFDGGRFLSHYDVNTPAPYGGYTLASGQPTQYLNRAISEDGSKVFFTSFDSLVPQDTNGHADAYVYDVATGEHRLLSSGECNCDSNFVEASPDGSNAFIATNQSLVRIDTDSSRDLYDVRVNGGIAGQNALPKAQCQGDACQSSAPPPNDATPASSSFQGAGNVNEAPKAKKHRKHKKHAKKHAKKHRRTGSAARMDLTTTTRSHG